MQIVVLDKLDYCATTNNLNSVKDQPNFKFVKGCIQSFDLVAHILESENIDTVMHFAAQVFSSQLVLAVGHRIPQSYLLNLGVLHM